MNILGINFGGHDTSAAVMVNGELLAACEEERYINDKHTRVFPVNAINDCLKMSGLTIQNIDRAAFCYKPDLLLKIDGPVRNMRRDLLTEESFKEVLTEHTGYTGPVDFYEHHICHLASAYYPSGFENALLMSNDGVGEVLCSLYGAGERGKITPIFSENKWPHSLGLLYSAVTFYLGWKPMYDEGITMGLAPLGDSSKLIDGTNKSYLEVFREIIEPSNTYGVKINLEWVAFHSERSKFVSDKFTDLFGPKRLWEEPITDNHKNIAAGLQDRLEEIVLEQLRHARKEFGFNKLCIAGGVGLNCSLNGKIVQNNIFDEVFVQPGAGDNGTAIGACYMVHHDNKTSDYIPQRNHNFYLGSESTDVEIEDFLNKNNFIYTKLNGDYGPVVEKLTERNIIGWMQGRAEFGPRALGNRSILTAPFPADIKDHINARVKFRESFRPFAPAVLNNYASEYFHIQQESPHMLMAVQVKQDKKEAIPAVIHMDDSARVQTVKKENNEAFYNLLSLFENKTGCPVLLNTSFNVKGQPIVNDISDAAKCFMDTNIDVLVAGDYMVVKGEQR